MSITVVEVCFFHIEEGWSEMITRVRAAFRDAAAAEVWAYDSEARLAQAREEWDEAFGPVPSLRWEATELRFSEVLFY